MKQVTLREYDYLISSKHKALGCSSGHRHAKCISDKAYEYLSRLLSRDEAKVQSDDHQLFLKRCSWKGIAAFQVQSYVGVLQTPCGTQIEILPKIAQGEDDEQCRLILIRMLRYLRNARFKLGGDVHLKHSPMHLLELFIAYFLEEVNKLVKRGVRSDYVTREENQTFLKGKLLVNKQVRVNAVQQQRFYVAHDEYLPDRAENRLIHTALLKVSRLTSVSNSQRLCQELLFIFNEVPISRNIRKDFSLCKFNRAMTHYRHTLEWCKLILSEESAVPSAGKTQAISILFPMERVFEDYVAARLKQYFPMYQVRSQSGGKYLVDEHRSQSIFALRPDLVIDRNGEHICVADTKWKQIDQNDRSNKYGISQSDMYQLYAYARKYDCKRVVLIYPYVAGSFDRPLDAFQFDGEFRLDVIPFSLHHADQCIPMSEILNDVSMG